MITIEFIDCMGLLIKQFPVYGFFILPRVGESVILEKGSKEVEVTSITHMPVNDLICIKVMA